MNIILMPAAVIPIGSKRRGYWSVLEIARPGRDPVPYGVLLAGEDSSDWTHRFRGAEAVQDLEEQEVDILTCLPDDLAQKASELGGLKMLALLEDSLSGFFRLSDRAPIAYSNARSTVDRLFDQYVDTEFRPFETHLPLYTLRAAATKFGEGMAVEEETWVRAPENRRITSRMFAVHIVGRSMEPRIPDGSVCICRAPVVGSRHGRLLLIEKFDETDFAARYTVKLYMRQGALPEGEERTQPIRLQPLNPEFEAFDLTSEQFRVIAEFVQVLYF